MKSGKIHAAVILPALAAAAMLTLFFTALCAFCLKRIANTVHVNTSALSVIAAQMSQNTLEEQGNANAHPLVAHISADIENRLRYQENSVRSLAAMLTAIYSNQEEFLPQKLPVLAEGQKPPFPGAPYISFPPGKYPYHTGNGNNGSAAAESTAAALENEAYLAANCANFLSMINTGDSEIIGVNIGTESGIVIACDKTHQPNAVYDPRLRPWFIGAKEKNDIVWNDIFTGIRGRGIIVGCSAPFYEIQNGKKTFKGAVFTSSLLTSFDSIMRTASGIAGNANDYFLLDNYGRFLFDSKGDGAVVDGNGIIQAANYISSSNEELAMLARKMVNQESGYIQIKYNNENVHIAYHPVRPLGWSLALVFSDRDLFMMIDSLERQILRVASDTEERTLNDMSGTVILMLASACLFFAAFAFLVLRFYKQIQTKLNDGVLGDKERIFTELDLAAQLQAHMIPRDFPPFAGRPYLFDIYGEMLPAKEIGGDFFDYFYIDDDHFAFVIADVSGKGISAALLMVAVKTLIKNILQSGYPLERAIEKANKQACDSTETGMFVSAWVGVLELSSGRIAFVNAGHNPPLLSTDGKPYEELVTEPDLVLGTETTTKYTRREVLLKEGDVLFLYTDGITETFDSKKNMFGSEQLIATINKTSRSDFRSMFREIKNALDEWTGAAAIRVGMPNGSGYGAFNGTEQFDDITMLAIRLHSQK